MKCKKCENNLDKDSKFCTKCGEKVSAETSHVEKKNEKKFESQTIKEIKTHLEFLGYSSEFDANNPSVVSLISRHSSKPTVTCNSSKENIVFLISTWNGLKELNNIEQYKCLNKLTLANTFSQLVINNDGNLNIFSTYMGEYNKKRFGEFLDIFINDINRTINDETFIKLIVK
jgi:hypothetical protein